MSRKPQRFEANVVGNQSGLRKAKLVIECHGFNPREELDAPVGRGVIRTIEEAMEFVLPAGTRLGDVCEVVD